MSNDGWKFAEQLLGITAEALKEREAVERLVRGQVADRLVAILLPDARGPRPVWTLDEALAEVERRVGALRTPLDNIKAEVRDAALEDVKSAVGLPYRAADPVARHKELVARIDALKSKPAPKADSDNTCPAPFGHSLCRKSLGHDGHHDLDGSVTAAEAAKASPVQCLVPGCDRPHQHEGPHSETSAPVITEETIRTLREQREARTDVGRQIDALASSDIHDFGWALAQMRAGKKVRRPTWTKGRRLEWMEESIWDGDPTGRSTFQPFSSDWGATDWEVAE